MASSGAYGLSAEEATGFIDTMQATIASAWERDVQRYGATDADVAAIAPALGNPGFEYEVDVVFSPTVMRRRRTT